MMDGRPAETTMDTRFVLRAGMSDLGDAVRSLWRDRAPGLERLLSRIPPGLRRVRVTLDGDPGKVTARLVLLLPGKPLTAEGVGPSVRVALDGALNRLVTQVNRHRHALLQDAADDRRRWTRDVGTVAPDLADLREHQDRAAFFQILRPLMRPLRSHARHDLEVSRLEGRLLDDDLTPTEVVDEVLVRAWERFGERPRKVPLQGWLLELLHEILDEWSGESAGLASLQDAAGAGDSRLRPEGGSGDPNEEWLEAWVDAAGPITVEELVPDPASHVETLETEEEYRLVLERLTGLSPQQRRTVLLHAFEGWDESEIGLLQDRDVEEVRADLATVRARLREHLSTRSGPGA